MPTASGAASCTHSTYSYLDISMDLGQPGTPSPISSTHTPPPLPCCCYHYHRIRAHHERLSCHYGLHTGYLCELWLWHRCNCTPPQPIRSVKNFPPHYQCFPYLYHRFCLLYTWNSAPTTGLSYTGYPGWFFKWFCPHAFNVNISSGNCWWHHQLHYSIHPIPPILYWTSIHPN